MAKFQFVQHAIGNILVAEVSANDVVLNTADDGNHLLGNAYYQGFEGLIISANNISPHFFNLKTRLAGEVLQKFSTFRMPLAIVGNLSAHTSESLQSFISESNRGQQIHFSPTLAHALSWFELRFGSR